MNDPYHYVAILGSTNKTETHVLEIGFHHESRQGASSSPLRDTLANASGPHTLGNPWMLQGRSSLTFEDWQFLNTRFPVLTDLYPRRLVSNNHTGE